MYGRCFDTRACAPAAAGNCSQSVLAAGIALNTSACAPHRDEHTSCRRPIPSMPCKRPTTRPSLAAGRARDGLAVDAAGRRRHAGKPPAVPTWTIARRHLLGSSVFEIACSPRPLARSKRCRLVVVWGVQFLWRFARCPQRKKRYKSSALTMGVAPIFSVEVLRVQSIVRCRFRAAAPPTQLV